MGLERTDQDRALLGARPVWLARPRFAVWSWGADFVGWMLWGHVATEDAEAAKQMWIALAGRIAPPYDFVLDLRRLESISSGAYRRIREFAHTAKPGLRRMAILVGEDTTGGVIQVGLFALRPPAYPWRSFAAPPEAASWLARPEAAGALLDAEALAGSPNGVSTPVARVRAILVEEPNAAIESVARRIGESPRSLQRHLAEHGTRFTDERDRARVAHAREMLLDPTLKLDAIAAAIGCADRRILNRLFRRLTGETPSQFRAARITGDR
jgi:AraC-like DNA-binding protein